MWKSGGFLQSGGWVFSDMGCASRVALRSSNKEGSVSVFGITPFPEPEVCQGETVTACSDRFACDPRYLFGSKNESDGKGKALLRPVIIMSKHETLG